MVIVYVQHEAEQNLMTVFEMFIFDHACKNVTIDGSIRTERDIVSCKFSWAIISYGLSKTV